MREVEVRSLVRVEKRPSLDSITIDSSNLDAYLAERRFVARESQFASHLDLRQHAPIIEKLYAETQEEFVLPEDDRMMALEVAELLRKDLSGVYVIEQLMHAFVANANMVAAVERSSVVYLDTGEKVIRASPVKFGTITEVEASTLDVLKEGNTAMIEIHTHPNDSLFSLNDYSFMLVGLDGGTPLVKSVMVLCPNIQVLAFATKGSPLVNSNEIDNLMEVLGKNLDAGISTEDNNTDQLFNKANTRSLEIARALSVKLYSSTNMKDFKAFSA